ncbi:NAD-dependent epimerase/dehydratase family protein [Teredinibacter purpureus]|uniref:NAD-dependent epimerase/dehydratase family protein n=1 Tax=Teredinibacter purpureus TaxID=2731756 RepID=UPI0005F79D9D|nr:NAD(P)-dependent oxidoreductase [Teredinibacter purpureus]
MRTIVVTGASGFIGQHLCYALTQQGYRVIAVTRHKPHARRFKLSFTVVDHYRNSPRGDALIHLAEESDRATVETLGAEYARDATALVEFFAHFYGTEMLYVSSCSVFGATTKSKLRPFTEEYPVDVSDRYTAIKTTNERTVLNTHGTVVRLSNIFGTGMAPTNVVSTILHQLHATPRDPIYLKRLRPIRDFLYVEDLTQALIAVINSSSTGLFNLASGHSVRIGDLAREILAAFGQPDRDVIATDIETPASVVRINTQKFKRTFSWSPQYSLTRGIHQLVEDDTVPIKGLSKLYQYE